MSPFSSWNLKCLNLQFPHCFNFYFLVSSKREGVEIQIVEPLGKWANPSLAWSSPNDLASISGFNMLLGPKVAAAFRYLREPCIINKCIMCLISLICQGRRLDFALCVWRHWQSRRELEAAQVCQSQTFTALGISSMQAEQVCDVMHFLVLSFTTAVNK